MGLFSGALKRLLRGSQQQRIAPLPGRDSDRFWNLFGLGTQRTRTDEQWARTFGENARLRVPLDAIATDVAAVQWHLYRRGRKGLEEVHAHALLDLLRLPHPLMPWSTWCYVVQIFLDLVGKAPVRITYRDGVPAQLTPIPPHWIVQLPHAGDKFFHVNWWGGDTERIPAREILWLYRPDPLNPFGDGLGLARALDDEVNQDEAMAKFNNYYFRHSAFLGAIVNLPGCEPDEVAELFRQEREGVVNACRTYVTDATDMKIENLSPKLRDLNFQDGRSQTRDFIREGFGLDQARVGVRGDRVQANDDASDHHQQSKIVLPRLTYLAEALNLFLVPLFGDKNLVLRPENPVRESKEEIRLKTDTGVRLGIMTWNEARQNLGMDPLPGGDVVSVPVNNVVLVDASKGDLVGQVQLAVHAMNSSGGDPGNQIQAKTASPAAPAPQQNGGGK